MKRGMYFSESAVKRILEFAPDPDKRCSFCLCYDKWKAVDWQITEQDTELYTYKCTSIEDGLTCDNTCEKEFELGNPAL